MNKSILLVLTCVLVALGTSKGWSADMSSPSSYASAYDGSDSTDPCSPNYHGPAAPDACVENYYSPRSMNPCEKYYAPRVAVNKSELSTTKGPLFDESCNELRSRKLFRGITNVTMAVGEIPAGAFREAYATSPVTGVFVGGVNGVATAVKRIGIGLIEIVTFPFPMNQRPTGETLLANGKAPAPSSEIATHNHECWGSMEGVDENCNVTRGTFEPYMEPEIVYMDALPPACE